MLLLFSLVPEMTKEVMMIKFLPYNYRHRI